MKVLVVNSVDSIHQETIEKALKPYSQEGSRWKIASVSTVAIERSLGTKFIILNTIIALNEIS